MSFKKAELAKYLECAKIVNTHGIAGALKLECRADAPEVLLRIKNFYRKAGDEYIPMKVTKSSVHKNMLLVFFDGITTPEDAMKYKNVILYADRADFRLRRGDFFIADIIGLPVYDFESGEVIGTMDDVLQPAGQQVYVIRKPESKAEVPEGEKPPKKTFMVPCVPEFIKKVSFGEDCDAGVYVSLIEGMDEV